MAKKETAAKERAATGTTGEAKEASPKRSFVTTPIGDDKSPTHQHGP